MKEKMKVDVLGSLYDDACGLAGDIGILAILLVFVGVLIAPAFSCFFKGALYEKYDPRHHYERFPMVRRKMKIINASLWLIAAISWVIFFWCACR